MSYEKELIQIVHFNSPIFYIIDEIVVCLLWRKLFFKKVLWSRTATHSDNINENEAKFLSKGKNHLIEQSTTCSPAMNPHHLWFLGRPTYNGTNINSLAIILAHLNISLLDLVHRNPCIFQKPILHPLQCFPIQNIFGSTFVQNLSISHLKIKNEL